MVKPVAADALVHPATLLSELQKAFETRSPRTARNAIATVFEEYKLFMASGRYPYTAEVVKEIALKYGLISDANQRVDHQAVHDAKNSVLIQLDTEVYFASHQYDVLRMQAEERELATQGFSPITELKPEAGMKVELPNGVPYRLKRAGQDWLLLAPGQRSHGLSLNKLVERHEAYKRAIIAGRTSTDSPGVWGFRLVMSPTLGGRGAKKSLGVDPQVDQQKPIVEGTASNGEAKRYPVIYAPATGSAHDKVKDPLGYASTQQGALNVASRALGRVPAHERRLAELQEYPDLYPDLTSKAGPVTAWTISSQLITRDRRRTRTASTKPAAASAVGAGTVTPCFTLSGPELGGPFIGTWTVTTPEGAAKKIIWNQEARRTGEPALMVSESVGGTSFVHPLVGERYVVSDGKRSTAQLVVERFVNELNQSQLHATRTQVSERPTPVIEAEKSFEPRLF